MPYLRSLLHAAVWACALAACGGSTDHTALTGSIAGTVRNVFTDELLAGATVSAGSVQATTDATGRFDLAGVPVGPSVTIRSQRTGFKAYAADIAVAEGSNTHDIRMTRQELVEFGTFALYVPAEVGRVRGVILGLGGPDTRGFATGNPMGSPNPPLEESEQMLGEQFRTLASDYDLAILGTSERGLPDATATDQRLLGALETAAIASGRPELREAPLLIYGISGGAPEAFGLTLRRPERVPALHYASPPRSPPSHLPLRGGCRPT